MGRLPASGLRLSAAVPRGSPRRVCQPADWLDHADDYAGHVWEVDRGELVRGLMVVLVQAIAGDRLRDDSLQCQIVVIRSGEEILCGMGVGDQVGPVSGEFGTQIASVEAGEPQ